VGVARLTRTDSSRLARICRGTTWRRHGGRWRALPTFSKQACQACSLPATYEAATSSASHQPSARDRLRLLACIGSCTNRGYTIMADETCTHLRSIASVKGPKRRECEECVKVGARWVHLRTCQRCGATLCCDSSPNRHASSHAKASGHPVIAS